MANPHNANHLAAVLLVFLLILLSSSSSSARRPLNDFSHAATESTLNLALPSDGVNYVMMAEKEEPAGHVSPCDHHHNHVPGMRLARDGKYGPLILNMLPKGKVPPSGPSKGTNNLNN